MKAVSSARETEETRRQTQKKGSGGVNEREEVRTDKQGIMSFSDNKMKRQRGVEATKRDEWVSRTSAHRLT